MIKRIIAALAALMLIFLTPANYGQAAAPVVSPISVGSVTAVSGEAKSEFIFTAVINGIKAGDDRYQVLLQLAEPNASYSNDERFITPLGWTGAAWSATRIVDKFEDDGKRLFRIVVKDIAANAVVAQSEDQYLSGVTSAITRQEVEEFLRHLADAYCSKNYAAFMRQVSPNFAGDDFLLANAIRKDFQLLNNITLRFTTTTIRANARIAAVSLNYQRTVTPIWTGQTINDSGVTEMMVVREKDGLKLLSMKKPLLFGLSKSVVATGIVVSGQNQNVLQISKDGTVYTGQVTSTSPAVKTIILHGASSNGQAPLTFEALRIADGTRTTGNSLANMDGDFGIYLDSVILDKMVKFKASYQVLNGFANINAVTSVPATDYQPTGYYFITSDPVIFALKLANGKYAVVQLTNFIVTNGNDGPAISATVLYKYQSDGTRNF